LSFQEPCVPLQKVWGNTCACSTFIWRSCISVYYFRLFKNEENGFSCRKLVLISAPSSMDSVIDHFSRSHNLSLKEKVQLTEELEKEFDFAVSDYSVGRALGNSPVNLLLIHDRMMMKFLSARCMRYKTPVVMQYAK